eukprot:jgi/Antlo1/166/774
MTRQNTLHSLWSEKHRPRKFTELLFSKNIQCDVLRWLKSWKPCAKPLLICGPSGYGKTTLVTVVGNMLGYNVVEINAGTCRTQELADKVIGLSHCNTITNKKNLVLVDEVDCIPQDIAFIRNLTKNSQRTFVPVVFTCNDRYNLQTGCFDVIIVQRPSAMDVANRLALVLKQEEVVFDRRTLLYLAEECAGDFRSILNTLQVMSSKALSSGVQTVRTLVRSHFQIVKDALAQRANRFAYYEKHCTLHVSSIIGNSYASIDTSLANLAEICESFSTVDLLPENYHFLPIDKVYKTGARSNMWSAQKPVPCAHRTRSDHAVYCTHILPFFKLFKEDRNNHVLIEHLKFVINRYKIEDTEWVVFVKNFVFVKKVERKKEFRYRYKDGYSMAVRRDISISKLLCL